MKFTVTGRKYGDRPCREFRAFSGLPYSNFTKKARSRIPGLSHYLEAMIQVLLELPEDGLLAMVSMTTASHSRTKL